MTPRVFAHEIGRQLRDDGIVACDSGTIVTWWARHIPARRGQMYSLSGNLATMASGLPYAIGAQVAYPDRQRVAFVGDGGFSMFMAELATCVKYRRPVKTFVVKNNTLGQIKWEQMVFLGHPEYGCELQPIDFALFAQVCGATGLTGEDPAECGRTVEQAFATPGSVVVQGVVDPFEPPMRPRSRSRRPQTSRSPARRAEPCGDRVHRPRRQGASARVGGRETRRRWPRGRSRDSH
jgi:pyruvate dehydrogenase (quinone)/pyruvate oxidase